MDCGCSSDIGADWWRIYFHVGHVVFIWICVDFCTSRQMSCIWEICILYAVEQETCCIFYQHFQWCAFCWCIIFPYYCFRQMVLYCVTLDYLCWRCSALMMTSSALQRARGVTAGIRDTEFAHLRPGVGHAVHSTSSTSIHAICRDKKMHWIGSW